MKEKAPFWLTEKVEKKEDSLKIKFSSTFLKGGGRPFVREKETWKRTLRTGHPNLPVEGLDERRQKRQRLGNFFSYKKFPNRQENFLLPIFPSKGA